jgi:hypothetical protein
MGCFWSLQGIKIHIREFLYVFMREAQQAPRGFESFQNVGEE